MKRGRAEEEVAAGRAAQGSAALEPEAKRGRSEVPPEALEGVEPDEIGESAEATRQAVGALFPSFVLKARKVIRLHFVRTMEELDEVLKQCAKLGEELHEKHNPREVVSAADAGKGGGEEEGGEEDDDEEDDDGFGDGRDGYHALFAHQMFGQEEQIYGFDALRVDLIFDLPSMRSLVRIVHGRALDAGLVEPVLQRIRCGIPYGSTTDTAAFRRFKALSSPAPPLRGVPAPDIEGGLRWAEALLPFDDPSSWGSEVSRYSPQHAPPSSTCVLRHWTVDSDVKRAFHRRMDAFSTWMIETADPISFDMGTWEVFASFLPGDGNTTALLGYAAVFRFHNPFRAERKDAGRLAQMLVLPPFARQGHGQRLLEAIYEYAESQDWFELTVESPSEGMVRLRDVVDLRRAVERGLFASTFPTPASFSSVPEPMSEAIAPPSQDALAAAHRELRTTVSQCRRVYELLAVATTNEDDAGRMRSLRLLLKRRLFKEVKDVPEEETRLAALDSLFRDEMVGYLRVLVKVGWADSGRLQRAEAAAARASETAEELVERERQRQAEEAAAAGTGGEEEEDEEEG